MAANDTYELLCKHLRETAVLGTVSQLLAWDEQTKMPASNFEHRAEQATMLASIIHKKATDPQLGEWLDQLSESDLVREPHSETEANIRRARCAYERRTKMPASLVEELARAGVLGQAAWVKARKNNDYQAFKPYLQKMLDLKRQEAEAVGYPECPYDALLDDYEPEMLASRVDGILTSLGEDLADLVDQIKGSDAPSDDSVLRRDFPIDRQESFATEMAKRIGFDFDRGRLDVTTHPFCCSPGTNDVRITTRYNPAFFNEAFFGVLHEAGHGIYEQGLRPDAFGLAMGEAVSLGGHESQSRLWENMVGRGRSFWEFALPKAQEVFPESLSDVSLDDFYRAVNCVSPSLIRVEADEATYNLHILIRFEMERELLSGDLSVDDAPEAWNGKYERYLGITPPDDRRGILQDVHWSAGLFGYFPTYALGNLMAAQLFASAKEELTDLDREMTAGEFDSLRGWLRNRVHEQGQRYNGTELIEKVTGNALSSGPLREYLRSKYGVLYRLS